jgi:phosphatidylserine decarboxylase
MNQPTPPAATPVTRLTPAEQLNFLLTNRLPRRWLTLFMGRFSRIEIPLLRALSIGIWRLFVDDLRLEEARKSEFTSLHDCFIRQLKPGARPVYADPDVLTSPCDAVVGEFGIVSKGQVLQAKGYPYSVAELLGCPAYAGRLEGALYVTLRLKSSMYHRFHAPCAGRVRGLRYISGDTWNVNPIALRRIERLYCRNERAVLTLEPESGDPAVTLVPVAAILVASMRIHGLAEPLTLEYEGPNDIALDRKVAKGEELGYFEHGSTIILFASSAFDFDANLARGTVIRMGRPLLRRRNLTENNE